MVETRGMELYKFHVCHLCPSSVAYSQTITGGDIRIAGVQIHLPCPSGCKNRYPGKEGFNLPSMYI